MLIPANRKYSTRRFGSRQQKRRKCEICKRNFRDYRILVDSSMRYVLCKNHLAFARKDPDHFHTVAKGFNLGTPVAELGAVV